MAAYGAIAGAISDEVKQGLAPKIRESLPALDPTWKYIKNSSVGVAPKDSLGREWAVIHTFRDGMSGAFRWKAEGYQIGDEMYANTSDGTSPISGAPLAHSRVPKTAAGFPTLSEVAMPEYFRRTISLVAGEGNVFLPLEYMRADQLTNSLGNAVADIIEGAAKNIAACEIASFFNTSGTGSYLGGVSQVDADGAASGYNVIRVDSSTNYFMNGMHVDLYNSTTQLNTVQIVVDNVDYTPSSSDTAGYGSITLKTKDGSAFPTLEAGTTKIYWWDSYGVGPKSPFYWTVNTGTVFGINFANFAQFKSIVDTSVGDLTESKMNRIVARLWKAYGMQRMPDTFLLSMGVHNALLETSIGLADRFNRPYDKANQLTMGFNATEESEVSFAGHRFKWIVSPNMPSSTPFNGSTTAGGRMLGLRLQDNNLKRYTPPTLPISRTNGKFGGEVEFPFAGQYEGIFKPMHNSAGQTTYYLEAPYIRWTQYAPEIMQGINLSGITEAL